LCVKLSSSVLPVQVRKKKRQAGMQVGRKSQEVSISRMCGATPTGQIITKLGTYVCLPNVIQLAEFYRYNLRGFGAVRS